MVLVHLHVHGACPCSCLMSILQVHVHAAHHRCVCVCVFVYVFVCVSVFVCINAGMPNCPASDQSGTGLKKTNNAGTGPVPDQAKAVRHFFGPVPDWNYWCRNADAQLCSWRHSSQSSTLIRMAMQNAYMTSRQPIGSREDSLREPPPLPLAHSHWSPGSHM